MIVDYVVPLLVFSLPVVALLGFFYIEAEKGKDVERRYQEYIERRAAEDEALEGLVARTVDASQMELGDG